jgi:hypothetical protein
MTMNRAFLGLGIALLLAAAGCQTQPIVLHTYSGGTLEYPDGFPNDRPTLLAFLDLDNRKNDTLVRPLTGLSARDPVKVIGVVTYSDNSFLQNWSTKDEVTFPVMLDPQKELINHFGVRQYPTFLYISVDGKEVAREYDVKRLTSWYKSIMIDKAMNRRHIPSPEDNVRE